MIKLDVHPAKEFTRNLPLVVDLDGTLTPTDTLVESLISLATKSPLMLIRVPLWMIWGRARFKECVAAHAGISAIRLPYRESFVTFLRGEKTDGRTIVLATAAHQSIAEEVSKHLGLFDEILATKGDHNLKGAAKLAAIEQRFGSDFVYAGDSKADIPIWKAARAAILVGATTFVSESIRKSVPIEREFPREDYVVADWLRFLRGQPWLVNLLVFTPLVTTSLPTDVAKFSSVSVAFVIYTFATTAVCLFNELRILDFDRLNTSHRFCPFASGQLPVLYGLLAAVGALIMANVLAIMSSFVLFLLLLVQIVLTSRILVRSQYVLIDVITETILCTFCVLTGSFVIGDAFASVLPFSACTFFALSVLRHYPKTVCSVETSNVVSNHHRLNSVAVVGTCLLGTALFAAKLVGLYFASTETRENSAPPHLLWVVAAGMVYFVAGRRWKSP